MKTIVGVTLLGLSFVAPKVAANSVVLTQDAYSYAVGGEFNADTSENFLAHYAPLTVIGNGFQTFCIETTVEFSPGQTYTYTLANVDSTGRDLTEGAAFLYDEFAKGTLAGYDYTDAATRNADAGELQAALWWFQGQQTYSGFPNPTNNVYYQEAILTLGLTQAEAANNGRFGVDVLQMWSGRTAVQNQLVLVPDNTTTVGMFALGLTALGVWRRRLQPQLQPA